MRVFQKPTSSFYSRRRISCFLFRKSKEEILRTKVLRMTRKGKLARILEHPQGQFTFPHPDMIKYYLKMIEVV